MSKEIWNMVAGAGAGGIMDILGGAIQSGQYNRNADRQMAREKEMSEFQRQQMMKTWNETNYSAQVDQLKKAGLNPALLYGNSAGPGGSTANAGGGSPSGAGFTQFNAMGIGLDTALKKAQIENIEADSNLKQTQAENTGVQTDKSKIEIESLTQGIENAKAQQELTKIQTELQNINFEKGKIELSEWLEQQKAITNKLLGEAESTLIQTEIDQNTKQTKINIIKQELINSQLDALVKDASIDLTNAQIKKIAEDIAMGWKGLGIDEMKTKLQQEYPSLMNVGGRAVQEVTEGIFQILNKVTGQDRSSKPYR